MKQQELERFKDGLSEEKRELFRISKEFWESQAGLKAVNEAKNAEN